MNSRNIDIGRIARALNRKHATPQTSDFDLNAGSPPPAKPLRSAAVLVPLIPRASGLNLVLTKRAAALKHHPGQVAFPGGKIEPGDSTAQTAALREAQEEIGLPPEMATPIGGLPRHATGTGFLVHPFVAEINPQFHPEPDPNEVAEVFEVPLSHVLQPDNFMVQGRVWQGQMRYYFTVPYGPYYIWGATARMLRMFAQLMENSDENNG